MWSIYSFSCNLKNNFSINLSKTLPSNEVPNHKSSITHSTRSYNNKTKKTQQIHLFEHATEITQNREISRPTLRYFILLKW